LLQQLFRLGKAQLQKIFKKIRHVAIYFGEFARKGFKLAKHEVNTVIFYVKKMRFFINIKGANIAPNLKNNQPTVLSNYSKPSRLN